MSDREPRAAAQPARGRIDLNARPRFERMRLINFLSYQDSTLEFDDFIALVGPNASGKSNAVAAMKLLREIPVLGLPTAIARRGGYDQLRHRSAGRPYDPALRIEFRFDKSEISYYEIRLGAVRGKRYEVKRESAQIHMGPETWGFESDGVRALVTSSETDSSYVPVAPGQSALPGSGIAGFIAFSVLQRIQTVEVNPARVGDLQEPSSTREFEPDGSNTASIYESLSPSVRAELVDELSAIVPGISRIEMRNLADRQTLAFAQETGSGTREFLAKQMSDGTLRAFSILLAMLQPSAPSLLVIEEPEIAIHLGALRTLVDILRQQASTAQIVITTHSADIVDSLDAQSLRVVWNDGSDSHLSRIAPHTLSVLTQGLLTPGQLLRADSLDAASA